MTDRWQLSNIRHEDGTTKHKNEKQVKSQ